MVSTEMKKMEKVWPEVSGIVRMPRNKSDYQKLCDILDELTDEVGNDEGHPLASLMETLGIFIGNYEEIHYNVPPGNGLDALKYLMEEHHLTQGDLKEIGSQGVVSEILNGKRELNLRQIRFRAKKFHVDASVFL